MITKNSRFQELYFLSWANDTGILSTVIFKMVLRAGCLQNVVRFPYQFFYLKFYAVFISGDLFLSQAWRGKTMLHFYLFCLWIYRVLAIGGKVRFIRFQDKMRAGTKIQGLLFTDQASTGSDIALCGTTAGCRHLDRLLIGPGFAGKRW